MAKPPAIDYHPLVNPIADFEIANFNIPLPSATPTSQHPTINTGAETPQTEPLTTTIIAAVTLVVVLAVAAGLLVYFKKRPPKSGGKT